MSDQPPQNQRNVEIEAEGWRAYVKGDFAAAESAFQQSLSIDGRSFEAYYGLGMCLKAQGKTQPALDAFQKTADLLTEMAPKVQATTDADKTAQMTAVNNRLTMLRHMAQAQISLLNSGQSFMRGAQ